MKLKTAFALLVATMAIDSRFDVVASSSSSSSSILDGSDPQATRKTRRVLNEKNKQTCQKENAEITALKKEIETLKSSLNDGGGLGSGLQTDITVLWHRPHHECGTAPGSNPEREVRFIYLKMMESVDFIGLSEYEAANEIVAEMRQGGMWPYSYGMIAASCRAKYSEPIRLYYNKAHWTRIGSYPEDSACQDPYNPPVGANKGDAGWQAPWKCGEADVVPNEGDGKCCSCTYKAASKPAKDRAWVAGIFQQTKYGKNTVCVVAAGLQNPSNAGGDGYGTIDKKVANFCGDYPIIFMADTNFKSPNQQTRSLFKFAPLSNLRDFSKPTYTCCANDEFVGSAKGASDRIATTGNLVIESITGGASTPSGTDYPTGFGYKCVGTASFGEHLPIMAVVTCPNNKCKG